MIIIGTSNKLASSGSGSQAAFAAARYARLIGETGQRHAAQGNRMVCGCLKTSSLCQCNCSVAQAHLWLLRTSLAYVVAECYPKRQRRLRLLKFHLTKLEWILSQCAKHAVKIGITRQAYGGSCCNAHQHGNVSGAWGEWRARMHACASATINEMFALSKPSAHAFGASDRLSWTTC